MNVRTCILGAVVITLISCVDSVAPTDPVGTDPEYELVAVGTQGLPAPFVADSQMKYVKGRLFIVGGTYKMSTERQSGTSQLADGSGTLIIRSFWSDTGRYVKADSQTVFQSARYRGFVYPAVVQPESASVTLRYVSERGGTYRETLSFRRRH